MHASRLPGCAAVARNAVCAGIIESSRGSASEAPIPWRNVRRGKYFLVMNMDQSPMDRTTRGPAALRARCQLDDDAVWIGEAQRLLIVGSGRVHSDPLRLLGDRLAIDCQDAEAEMMDGRLLARGHGLEPQPRLRNLEPNAFRFLRALRFHAEEFPVERHRALQVRHAKHHVVEADWIERRRIERDPSARQDRSWHSAGVA